MLFNTTISTEIRQKNICISLFGLGGFGRRLITVRFTATSDRASKLGAGVLASIMQQTPIGAGVRIMS